MNPGFDALESMVRQLWPTYRASVQPMWDTRLSRYSTDELSTTLWRHRADNPDDTKPHWKTIYGLLAGGNMGVGKSDLRILLDSMRRTISRDPAWMKQKPINAWTDPDLFENFVEANVRPVLRDMDGTVKDDSDGRLARLAARTRMSFASPYIADLKERGDPVPEWLVR